MTTEERSMGKKVKKDSKGEVTSVLDLFRLDGKTALVTGANGGIGGAVARALAEAGADIVVFQIPGEQSTFATDLAKQTGRNVDVYDCDLQQSESIDATVHQLFEKDHRTVDILCNVAGITGGFVPVLDEDDAHVLRVFQIHVLAVHALSRKVAQHMAKRGKGGKILNVTSYAAHRAMTRFSVYGPAKAAVLQLTRTLATELAVYDIQANAVCPGWIHTPLSQRMVDDPVKSENVVKGVPAGRWGKPGDLKGVAVFLASAASDYITGTEVVVDGGALLL